MYKIIIFFLTVSIFISSCSIFQNKDDEGITNQGNTEEMNVWDDEWYIDRGDTWVIINSTDTIIIWDSSDDDDWNVSWENPSGF